MASNAIIANFMAEKMLFARGKVYDNPVEAKSDILYLPCRAL